MSNVLETAFGIQEDKRRSYHLQYSQDVSQSEFETAQILSDIVFGKEGLVESLGSTWEMVHDPRWLAIEECFIRNRPSKVGGNADVVSHVTSNHVFQMDSIADLELYSEVLGEGRHFTKVLTERGEDPREFYKKDDVTIWNLIRQECPNYFRRDGTNNVEAGRLHAMIKIDLLGLICDYAELAYCDDWVSLVDGEYVEASPFKINEATGEREDEFRVYAEVDMIERALTLRASLRATAIRVLAKLGGLDKILADMVLTPFERDVVTRMLYSGNWGTLYKTVGEIVGELSKVKKYSYEERFNLQIGVAKKEAQTFQSKLKNKEILRLTIKDNGLKVERLPGNEAEDAWKAEAVAEGLKAAEDPRTAKMAELFHDTVAANDKEGFQKLKAGTVFQRAGNTVREILRMT